jgi:hypothetical protein
METMTLDPKQVLLIVAGVPINDWKKLRISRDEPMFKKYSGIVSTARVKTNNKGGKMVLSIPQTSLNNDVLTALRMLDEATNQGVFPIEIKDMTGTSNYFTAQGWIEKAPEAAYDTDGSLNDLEWTFDCSDLSVIEGGNLLSGAVI